MRISNKKILLMIAVLVMVVGFAAVSSILYLTGTVNIAASDDFKVYYSAASMTPMKEGATIERQDDNTNLVFNTGTLTDLGEKIEVEYTIKNDSRNYDANVVINCDIAYNSEYVKVTNKIDGRDMSTVTESDPLIIPMLGTKEGKIEIELIKSYAGETKSSAPMKFSISAVAKEKRKQTTTTTVPTSPILLSEKIIEKKNETNTYNDETKKEVFEFSQAATGKTGESIDYRYIGDEPNNYIEFNGETWRIIGVFQEEDKEGNIRNRVKIIRDEALPNTIYDDKMRSNNWTETYLYNTLNSETKGSYYSKLSNVYKKLISDKVKFYSGNFGRSATQSYTAERSTSVYESIDYFGLMYLSDYLYTYALGINDDCFDDSSSSVCGDTTNHTGSWLYKDGYEWIYMGKLDVQTRVLYNGKLTMDRVLDSYGYHSYNNSRPVTYLNYDVLYDSGDGSVDNKYKVKMELPTSATTTEGTESFVSTLLSKKNSGSTYNNSTKGEMFTYSHESTEQLSSSTDYRYIGDEPNNYLKINGETWRIVGVFPTEDGYENINNRVKIIKDDYQLARYLPASTVGSSPPNIRRMYSLINLLNDYSFNNIGYTFAKNTLEYFDNVKYYLGYEDNTKTSVSAMYTDERSGNESTVNKLALIYQSDYYYANKDSVSSGCLEDISTCTTQALDSNWLYDGTSISAGHSCGIAWFDAKIKSLSTSGFCIPSVRAVGYLNKDIKYVSGDGTIGSPYEISI